MWIFDRIPWVVVFALCATLGLAPFMPEPHLWEKLKMLVAGELVRGIDWLDLAMHGAPFVLLLLKALRESQKISKG